MAAERKQALDMYWRGRPIPEADRLAQIRIESFCEDLFESTADEFEEAMRNIDEYERNTPDRV